MTTIILDSEKAFLSGELESISTINKKIMNILRDEKLDKYNNDFFIQADLQEKISLDAAFNVAYNWAEITKNFLFTSIKGLGVMAEKMRHEGTPDDQALYVLQTAFGVISDDLNNVYPTFSKVAPKGPKGIHYRWWEESILVPLKKIVKKIPPLSAGAKLLIAEMNKLSANPFGVAVQLRVVETLALDITVAFLSVFSKVEHQGKKIFDDTSKLWITAHIEAETIHNQQVSNEIYGMAKIAFTRSEQDQMLSLVQNYASAWRFALKDFAKFLEIP